MTCIIIEDQPPAQRILQKYIEDFGGMELAATFSDALQAVNFLSQNKVDLIFLDIHLPKISGIEFLKTLPNAPQVILTTAYPEYALEGYELNVVDYLLKPFSFERFIKAVAKVQLRKVEKGSSAAETAVSPTKKEIFIKSGYEHLRIDTEDIICINSDADYTELITAAKKHLTAESLRHWMELLDEEQFVRTHKSHIVNMAKIEKVVGNQVYLSADQKVPVGRAYKEAFMKRIVS